MGLCQDKIWCESDWWRTAGGLNVVMSMLMGGDTTNVCKHKVLLFSQFIVFGHFRHMEVSKSTVIFHFSFCYCMKTMVPETISSSKGEPFFRLVPSVSFTINSADWTMSKSTSWINVFNKCKKIISWHVQHGWHHVFQLQSQRKQMWLNDTLTQLKWKRTHVLVEPIVLLIKPSNWFPVYFRMISWMTNPVHWAFANFFVETWSNMFLHDTNVQHFCLDLCSLKLIRRDINCSDLCTINKRCNMMSVFLLQLSTANYFCEEPVT